MFNCAEKALVENDEAIVIDWLMYRSYEFNRDRSPEIEPQRWRKIYFNADLYEKIYQGTNK
jgi:hypothetical protein